MKLLEEEEFTQQVQVCVEMNFHLGSNKAICSVFNIIEYEVTWPMKREQKDKYKFSLVGTKLMILSHREPKPTYFAPNFNKDTWDINGSKLKLKLKSKVFY